MKRLIVLLVLTGCCVPAPEPDPPIPMVAIEGSPPPYDRSDWGRWWDADHDCQDTRQEVLIAESLSPVEMDDRGCRVLSGRWRCPLTGITFTNPSELDIDHLVPLHHAHEAGGWAWDKDLKRAFFNDLDYPNHLMATSASANRSKGARTPLDWMPPNQDFHCEYLTSWMLVKVSYKLEVTCEESAALAMMMAQACERPVEVPPAP